MQLAFLLSSCYFFSKISFPVHCYQGIFSENIGSQWYAQGGKNPQTMWSWYIVIMRDYGKWIVSSRPKECRYCLFKVQFLTSTNCLSMRNRDKSVQFGTQGVYTEILGVLPNTHTYRKPSVGSTLESEPLVLSEECVRVCVCVCVRARVNAVSLLDLLTLFRAFLYFYECAYEDLSMVFGRHSIGPHQLERASKLNFYPGW